MIRTLNLEPLPGIPGSFYARPIGWARPSSSKLHHYFVDGNSICGKHIHRGGVTREYRNEQGELLSGQFRPVRTAKDCRVCLRVLYSRSHQDRPWYDGH